MTVNIYHHGKYEVKYTNVLTMINHSVDTSDGDGIYLEMLTTDNERIEIKIDLDTFYSVWQ